MLAVIVWLIWERRQALFAAPDRTAPIPGFALLVFGLLLYAVGRSHDIFVFEIGALTPILAGVLLATRGWPAVVPCDFRFSSSRSWCRCRDFSSMR